MPPSQEPSLAPSIKQSHFPETRAEFKANHPSEGQRENFFPVLGSLVIPAISSTVILELKELLKGLGGLSPTQDLCWAPQAPYGLQMACRHSCSVLWHKGSVLWPMQSLLSYVQVYKPCRAPFLTTKFQGRWRRQPNPYFSNKVTQGLNYLRWKKYHLFALSLPWSF